MFEILGEDMGVVRRFIVLSGPVWRTIPPALAAASFLIGSSAYGADAGVILARVLALSAGERASLVLEMTDQVASVHQNRVDRSTVILEAGPMGKPVQLQDLTPDPPLACIKSVSVRGYRNSAGSPFARVQVALSEGCTSAMRMVGRRIYLDLTRSESAEAAASHPVATSMAAGAPPNDPFKAFDADVRRRARTMAERADVKGLLALHDEVVQKDKALGHPQPALLTQLLDDLAHTTEQARALRLKLDRAAFQKQD